MPSLQPVVLDACVLIPSRLRDFLLSLAAEGVYRPIWNTVIMAELEYHERERHHNFGLPDTDADQIARNLTAQMNAAFNDSLTEGWEDDAF